MYGRALRARRMTRRLPPRLGRAVGNNAIAVQGLFFAANLAAGSDVRIVFNGSNLPSRTAHTAIWQWNSDTFDGYRAQTWFSWNDGSFRGDQYEFGAHPFPCDGAFDGSGQATGGTASSGTVRYFESAGCPGAVDHIANPVSSISPISEASGGGTIYTSARTVRVSGSNLIHRVYKDVINAPSEYIEITFPAADLTSPSAPAFYFGASDWRSGLGGGGATSNDETPGGLMRMLRIFNVALDASGTSDLVAEASVVNNSAATATGASNIWYSNISPTPSDITDKSGAGHNPSWANANRPTLWTP